MSFCRCFSSLGCPERSLDEVLALAERNAVGAVELRALGGTVDLAAYFTQHYGTHTGLKEKLANARVKIVALNASLKVASPTEVDRAQLERLAPWADAAGAGWLRVFDGGTNGDAADVACAAETLAWWEHLRIERGWRARLMVETHDAFFTAATIARLIAAVPDAAILWDAHHTWRKGGEDPRQTWAAIRANVVHVHVKDSIPEPSARHPFTYVLPGDGGFPIADVRGALQADGFGGSMSLEWERMWHPYLPPLEDALRVAAARGWW